MPTLSQAISAEIRATMARKRITGLQLAGLIGMSQNYLAKRLRDEAPFTIPDLAKIADVLDEDFEQIIRNAIAHMK